MRDLRIFRIFEGTNDILRLFVALNGFQVTSGIKRCAVVVDTTHASEKCFACMFIGQFMFWSVVLLLALLFNWNRRRSIFLVVISRSTQLNQY